MIYNQWSNHAIMVESNLMLVAGCEGIIIYAYDEI